MNDGRIVMIACGALGREVRAICDAFGLDQPAIVALPAALHNTPDKIPDAVREAIGRVRGKGGKPVVAYADCGTGGLLDRICAAEGVPRIPGPHCYSFFTGNEAFAARAGEEIDAFYLTDFLARQFEELVWRGLGLDRHPDLRDMYFGHYRRLVYLAQTDDAALSQQAAAAADRLGLAYERRFTGYGDLATFVTKTLGGGDGAGEQPAQSPGQDAPDGHSPT